jgi:CheY-like chemotaxis protein
VKILLIDDSADSLESLAIMLRMVGHEVYTRADGLSGLNAALEYQPNVIFCDIGLPGLTGLEVARRLRNHTCMEKTLLVALTGYSQAGDRRESRKAGFDYHLVKPLEPSEIMEVLSAHATRLGVSPGAVNLFPKAFVPVRRVLLVENDADQARPYSHALADASFQVTHAKSAGRALKLALAETFDLVILDIQMATGTDFSPSDTAGGTRTGLALARRIRQAKPDQPLVALTFSEDPEVKSWFGQGKHLLYLNKAQVKPNQLPRVLRRSLFGESVPVKMFIVHGRDHQTMDALRWHLRNELRLGEPTVLAEMPTHGKTIIEKLEHYATDVDLVFVLMTPDDTGYLSSNSESAQQRARQNVIFECGYFLGMLRRQTGRVVLLHKGLCELPSDILGIGFIDVTNGIEAADAELRKELADWLPRS